MLFSTLTQEHADEGVNLGEAKGLLVAHRADRALIPATGIVEVSYITRCCLWVWCPRLLKAGCNPNVNTLLIPDFACITFALHNICYKFVTDLVAVALSL